MPGYADLFKRSTMSETAVRLQDKTLDDDLPQKREGFSLLLVDDEEGVLKAIKRVFLEENYEILTAGSADKALDIMEQKTIHLVISDYRMPGRSGAELLKDIKQRWPDTIRIMLTGHADIQSIMGAVSEGAVYKFITKPWNDEDLRLTVSLAFQQYSLIQENKALKEITKKQELRIKNYSTLVDENRGAMGNILIKSGLIKKAGLERALKEKKQDEFLSEALVRLGITTESKIIKAMQDHLNIEYVDLEEIKLNPNVVKFLPGDYCERNRLIPIMLDNRQIRIAMADPSDIFKCDNITFMTGLKVVPVIAGSSTILNQLKKIYGDRDADIAVDFDDISEIEPLDEIDIIINDEDPDINLQELIGTSEIPPIIRIVNAVISEAIRYKASDIHIEPKTKYTIIRYRIDGMLHAKIKIPPDFHLATISRIKILAKMDIAERRKPQDGRITVKSGTRIVDIRVSTMPTINGEKVVMRILDKSAAIKNLDELGVLPDDLKRIYTVLKKPQGIIISTGPTGSGKTTMLYSILSAMLKSTKNFETIEDPVEYFLEGASQVFVKEKIGLSFASVLRSTLRQDPDVILVGEIRDYETADVAFKAALTGHMVLTTLHTNNSIASITRLIDMGIKPYLIASALEGILAQRLVRRVCKYCKVEETPDKGLLQLLKAPEDSIGEKTFSGKGCERCNDTGYLGRTGIFEIFIMNDDFRHIISSNYKESELMHMARISGMRTLVEDGIEKVKNGETTLEELIRVIGPQTKHERQCNNCKRTIDAKFIFCPYCGTFKQNFCRKCMIPLEEDWNICPLCGSAKFIDIDTKKKGE
ncbi:MAG TPA: response regulator [Nitrospirae bacterium]|nr:type II secretion system protein E [bacterium BMS3Abin06]HDH12157.1 response regulator [Nitrospirota bacterium]HDZ02138.1 response regulator [Nitrospirota bacterium]